jgi:triacylglycerol lipase
VIPIVLHHGLMGFGDLSIGPVKVPYFRGIDRAIRQRGHPVIISRVHPTASVETRAEQLKENILRGLEECDGAGAGAGAGAGKRVIVVGHSMGGLDARYMVARLGMADKVAALLTVTTPHRGSPYADWCLENLGRRLGGLALMKKIGLDVQAISDLTLDSCRKFNRKIKNVPGVLYFSVSAARPWHRVPAFALHAHRLIAACEGDNDCLVSVKSSTWGEHLGTWPADHFHAVNHKMIFEIREKTGNIAPYYLAAIEKIVERIS